MNFVYLLIIVFMLFKKGGNSNLIETLKNLDYESIAPFLETFNVNPKIKETLKSDSFKNFLNGEFNLSSLLPLITPFISEFFKPANTFNSEDNPQSFVNEYLSPIKDFASDYVTTSFKDYFEN